MSRIPINTELEQRLILATPVGKDAALSAINIWKTADIGPKSSARHTLNRIAAEHKIHCKSVPTATGYKYLYWRAQ